MIVKIQSVSLVVYLWIVCYVYFINAEIIEESFQSRVNITTSKANRKYENDSASETNKNFLEQPAGQYGDSNIQYIKKELKQTSNGLAAATNETRVSDSFVNSPITMYPHYINSTNLMSDIITPIVSSTEKEDQLNNILNSANVALWEDFKEDYSVEQVPLPSADNLVDDNSPEVAESTSPSKPQIISPLVQWCLIIIILFLLIIIMVLIMIMFSLTALAKTPELPTVEHICTVGKRQSSADGSNPEQMIRLMNMRHPRRKGIYNIFPMTLSRSGSTNKFILCLAFVMF